jgi:hypothetical protein
VPIDGIYWFDPKATARADASKQSKTKDAGCASVSLPLGKSS